MRVLRASGGSSLPLGGFPGSLARLGQARAEKQGIVWARWGRPEGTPRRRTSKRGSSFKAGPPFPSPVQGTPSLHAAQARRQGAPRLLVSLPPTSPEYLNPVNPIRLIALL